MRGYVFFYKLYLAGCGLLTILAKCAVAFIQMFAKKWQLFAVKIVLEDHIECLFAI